MACYHPITAWRARSLNKSGKRALVFNKRDGFEDMEVQIPCGRCIGCKLEYSRQWAIRCVHESKMHKQNSFITLTYDEEHLPANGSLNKKHIVRFFKDLRKKVGFGKFRYYQAGEYGDTFARPHHHVCMFGFYPDDAVFVSRRRDYSYYQSDLLDSVWKRGNVIVTDLTFETAAYTARYCIHKRSGPLKDMYYDGLTPEYCTMSRMPGIGKTFWDKFKNDIITQDQVVIRNNMIIRPAKYYDKLFDGENPKLFRKVKNERIKKQKANAEDNTYDRLAIKEELKQIKLKQLKRSYENA